MGKKSSGAKDDVKVVRGMRRHNRSNGHGTVNQDIARSFPKWRDVGGDEPVGVLTDRNGNFLRRCGTVYESIRKPVHLIGRKETNTDIAAAAE